MRNMMMRMMMSLAGAFLACGLAGLALANQALASEFNPAAPAAFQFGEGVESHAQVFETLCSSFDARERDPAEIPLAQTSLVQVDCSGFDYFGAPRLAEFVFADGALTHVWVLTTAEEEAGLRAAFEADFGAPTHEAEMVIAFIDNNVAIRRDNPEVVYVSDQAAPFFRTWFDQIAAQ